MRENWKIVFEYSSRSQAKRRDSCFLLNVLMNEGLPFEGKPMRSGQDNPEIFISPSGYSTYGFNRRTLEQEGMLKKFQEYCDIIKISGILRHNQTI